ncbi:MAG: flagellar hook-basal body complex protein FliE [Ignavibacteriaceae bacterium]|nr:flagellar hook-basal body complex protein FliE [Ignavibacteriaceae bacterium]
MIINSISNIAPEIANTLQVEKKKDVKFDNVLTDFIGQVNQTQLDANNMTNNYIGGGNIEIQDVMIAGEKASTSLQLLTEIRNKALDMYKTLTNIQI